MSINIIASIVSFGVTIGINFFLTPYLVKEVGTDAYGFIGLANNFVQYATIVTTALNAISGRFISIAYHKGDVERSSKIFSSVLVADLFLAAVMLILSAVFVGLLDLILNIRKPHCKRKNNLWFCFSYVCCKYGYSNIYNGSLCKKQN